MGRIHEEKVDFALMAMLALSVYFLAEGGRAITAGPAREFRMDRDGQD